MSETDQPKFAAVAREVTGDWSQIVALWEQFRLRHGLRLRADLGDTDQQGFVAEALGSADNRGRLEDLVALLEERELVSTGFSNAVAPFCAREFALQSVVNGVWRTQTVSGAIKWIHRARNNVCRISVDERHRGSGLLIKPNLVVTAAHVVEPLVDIHGEQIPDSLGRLAIHFSPEDDEEELPEPIVAQLHMDWLAYYSAPAPQENRGLAIDSIVGIADVGPWDLAVLQLSKPPLPGMTGYSKLASIADPPSFGMHVFHHPANDESEASEMLWSVGQIRQALGGPQPLRWLHDASTSNGSSGAPCFDNAGKLIALHQAGPYKLLQPGQNNRAVPIFKWALDIDRWTVASAAVPYLSFVTDELNHLTPVLGRRDLQSAMWRAMIGSGSGPDRAFIIRGEAGLGKAFTVTIAKALARSAGLNVVAIDVRNAEGESAAVFAQGVAGALAEIIPAEQVAPSGLTSTLRDLTNDVGPALLTGLKELAKTRQIWLALYGWEEAAFPPHHEIRLLVDILLAGLPQAPGVHLILPGWTGTAQGHFLETLAPPTAQDITDHVLAAVMPGGEEPAPVLAMLIANLVGQKLDQALPGAPFERAVAVAEEVRVAAGGRPSPAAGGAA